MTMPHASAPDDSPMKILLLCNGLQPGRDGVGDYTRLLAGEWARLGHDCGIIALNDPHLAAPAEGVIEAGRKKITCLRLPSASSWTRRAEQVRNFRSRFIADWISFQFVSYGLDDKGNVAAITPVLHELTSGRPLHLMFHELWTGGQGLSNLRHQLAGAIQRRSLKKMIAVLQPRLVTTSNPAFVAMLKRIGTTAALSPLFGNVPVAPASHAREIPAQLAEAGMTLDGPGRRAWWLAIFFGAIHAEWKPEPFLGILRRAARRANKRVALVQTGRAGAAGEATWEKLKRKYRSDFVFLRLGEQPVATVSALLQVADFGVATSPWHLIGKSGATAAMLDHGLPVIVTRDDFQPTLPGARLTSPDPLLHPCNDALEAKLRAGLPKRAPHARLGEIAARLCGQFRSLS
jgi:hypothetical protein